MADDYFLKIMGIEGESQDARHKDEITLDAWSFGGTTEITVGGRLRESPQVLQGQVHSVEDSPRRTFSLWRRLARPHRSF
jgi:type VI protein secretion system component Hcp